MKNSLFALATAVVMGSTIQSAYAADYLPYHEIIQNDETEKDWTVVQQIDGIAVSYSIVAVGDERFLSIQFENTNNEDVDFIWSLLNHNSAVTITIDGMIESIVQLASNDAKIVDGTYLIEMKSDDEFSDFVVLINPNTRYTDEN